MAAGMNEAQRDAIHQSMRDQLGIETASKVAKAIEDRYRLPQPVNVYLNLMLREASRLDHGDTARWDSSALALGFDPSLYERRVPV